VVAVVEVQVVLELMQLAAEADQEVFIIMLLLEFLEQQISQLAEAEFVD
jgi:hypothetical protein